MVKFYGIDEITSDATGIATTEAKPDVLTIAKLEAMQPGETIATGIVENSPRGVYMTDNHLGDKLRWIAVRGVVADWAIYIYWATHSENYIRCNGDKVISHENIQKLVPCTPDAFHRYRY